MYFNNMKLAVAGFLTLSTGLAQAASISLDVIPGVGIDSFASFTQGETFSVDVVVDDVLDLAAFEFDIGFDPAVVAANPAFVSGDVFGIDTFEITNTVVAGVGSFSETTFAFSGVNITVPTVIATLTFDASSAGNSVLSLGNVIFGDSFGDEIMDVTTVGADIQVNQASGGNIPLPSVPLLLVFGIAAVRWKAKRNTGHSPVVLSTL